MALTLAPPPSPDSRPGDPAPLPLGSITPRLWTRPLRKLTPRTSYGFAVIHFAATVLEQPLDPWQQWVVIHLGELLEDGRPRFRQVLILVARQQGKTHLCKVLALFWMFVERWALIFGTSTNLDYARESWQQCVDLAEETKALLEQMPARKQDRVRYANGEQVLRMNRRLPGPRHSRYKIGAANRRGGRSLSIDRIIGDELREHHTWDAYNASYNAMNARPHGQAVYISNQGDAKAIVLSSLRKSALEGDDPRIGLFEYSAPEGSHPMDPAAWAAAMPQLGRRTDHDTVRSAAARVAKPGADPEELAGFLTEMLCMSVDSLDPAIDPSAWREACDPGPLDVTVRGAGCIDVSPDMLHATLVVAQVMPDGRYRGEVVKAWDGPRALEQLRDELPAAVVRYKLKTLGWFPKGPAAVIDADLRDRRKVGRMGWPPRGVTVQPISDADSDAVCMGLAEQVIAGKIIHSGQELLDAHVAGSGRTSGVKWQFERVGSAHIDAAYAFAGAIHLARTLPTPRRLAGANVV